MKFMEPKNWSSTRLLAVVFTMIIIFGTILLELPISTQDNSGIRFIDALFTATSATCVTGLSLFDTYTQFTFFGQAVILLLIQVGGLGFITVAMLFSLATHRRIGLRMHSWLADGIGSLQLTGIVRMVRRVLWFSFFHSVSAFCNAGFDLMGAIEPSSSLTRFYNDPLVMLTISALIIIGGIGFIIWTDIVDLVSLLEVEDESIIMVFLLGVLCSAILTNSPLWSVVSAVISLMIFNFLFTEPCFTFQVYSASDLILLLFFLVTATIMGMVTSRLKTQMERANRNERTAKMMYEIASGFLSAGGCWI